MSTWLPGVSQGEIIKAEHYNTMLARFTDFWIGGSYTYNDDHIEERIIPAAVPYLRHGWGQPDVLPQPVAVGQIITFNEVNILIALINVAINHVNKDQQLLIPLIAYVQGDPNPQLPQTVQFVFYERIMAKLDYIENYKFDTMYVTTGLGNIEITTTSGFQWNEDLICIYGATFANYNEARHYFNSGGKIWFELDADAGAWQKWFDRLGTIEIGAIESTTSDPIITSIIKAGFYDLEFGSDWTLIFDASGISMTQNIIGEYGSEYYTEYYGPSGDYGDYNLGEYDQRRFRIYGRCVEDSISGEFRIEFRLVLMEDPTDDVNTIVNSVTATAGYNEVLSSPDQSGYYYSYNNIDYSFTGPVSPTMQALQVWSDDDVPNYSDPYFVTDYINDIDYVDDAYYVST